MSFSTKIFDISRVMIFTLQEKQSLDSIRLIRKIFSQNKIFLWVAILVAVSTDYVIKKFLLWNRIIEIWEKNKII